MVDIHCHILPGLDDGAADMDEALVMARVAAQSGSRTIIATPHAGHAEAKASPEAIRAAVKSLQQQVDAAGIDLKLLPGMELLCGSRLERILHNGAYLTLAGSRYLLVEFYFDETLPAIRGMLHSIVEHGLTPVIAHPERYEAVQRDPWVAAAWMEQGYGIQINAGSLLGYLGSDAKRTGKWLVRNGLAHLAASDGHNLETRPPRLQAVRDYLEDRVSVACAEALLFDNPQRILQDLPLPRYR